MAVDVRRVAVADTYQLRHQILRPHQTIAELGFAGEDEPATAYFAAFDADDAIIGVVTVLRQAPAGTPDTGDTARWWRLRGMAIAEAARRQGVGRVLVDAVIAHAAAHGGTRLWCQSRLAAVGFYERLGFHTTGEPWEEPVVGPHIAMERAVTAKPEP